MNSQHLCAALQFVAVSRTFPFGIRISRVASSPGRACACGMRGRVVRCAAGGARHRGIPERYFEGASVQSPGGGDGAAVGFVSGGRGQSVVTRATCWTRPCDRARVAGDLRRASLSCVFSFAVRCGALRCVCFNGVRRK